MGDEREVPAREIPLCRLDEIPDGEARGFSLPDLVMGALLVMVLREGDTVRVFWNRCPHRGTPLDVRPDDFLDREREYIVCATHGALFRKDDGICVSGPCEGQGLVKLDARVEAGRVLVSNG